MPKGINSFKKSDRNDLERIVANLKGKGFRAFLHACSLENPRDKYSPIIISLDIKMNELPAREKQLADITDYTQAVFELQKEGATFLHCGQVGEHLCHEQNDITKTKLFYEEMTIVCFEKMADVRPKKKRFQIMVVYDEHKAPFKFLELNYYQQISYLEL